MRPEICYVTVSIPSQSDVRREDKNKNKMANKREGGQGKMHSLWFKGTADGGQLPVVV